MDRAPLPPHERPWRHPSEVAAAAAATRPHRPSGSSRAIIAAGGVTGALLVSVGLWVMTPGGAPAEFAAVPATGSGPTVTRVALGATVSSDVPAKATVLGDGAMALVTRRALLEQLGDRVDASASLMVSAGGRAIEAALAPLLDVITGGDEPVLDDELAHLARLDELVLVVLDREDRTERGYLVASRSPEPDDMVTVLSDPPVEVEFHEVDDLDVADGTAVVDQDGALVGICTWSDGAGDGPSMVFAEVVDRAGVEVGLSASSSVVATAPRRPLRRRLPRAALPRARRGRAPAAASV